MTIRAREASEVRAPLSTRTTQSDCLPLPTEPQGASISAISPNEGASADAQPSNSSSDLSGLEREGGGDIYQEDGDSQLREDHTLNPQGEIRSLQETESLHSSQAEDFSLYAQGVEEEEENGMGTDPTQLTPQQMTDFLSIIPIIERLSPNSTGSLSEPVSLLSQSEQFCLTSEPATPKLAIQENELVTRALEGSLPNKSTTPRKVANLEGEWGVGKFVKNLRSTFSVPRVQKTVLIPKALPSKTSSVSSLDLKIAKGSLQKGSLQARLPESVLSEWQENSRRGLELVSILETLNSTTMKSVLVPQSNPPVFTEDSSAVEVTALLHHMATGIRLLSGILATSHSNVLLARRDTILQTPQLDIKPEFLTQMRTLPADSESLFGPATEDFLEASRATDKDDFVYRVAQGTLAPQGASRRASLRGQKRHQSPHRALEAPAFKVPRLEAEKSPQAYDSRRGGQSRGRARGGRGSQPSRGRGGPHFRGRPRGAPHSQH